MTAPSAAAPASLSRGLLALMVVTVFSTSGTIHYQTPMLGAIAAGFSASPAAAGWVATLSFGGYFAGTMCLVPLGDSIDKRTMVIAQMVALVAFLVLMAAAPSLGVLSIGAFFVGIFCSVSQHITPVVSERAAPEAKGRAVGTVLTGLFVGILFARLAGGVVAAHTSWRVMYAAAACMVGVMLVAVCLRLPAAPPKTRLSWAALMRSMGRLWLDHPPIRIASAIQLLVGIGYGGFWATVAPMLASLHGLGPVAAGLMAIPGAAGVLVSRPAGRWMDRSGVAPVVVTGVGGVLAAFVAFALAPRWVGAAVIGAVLLDCGLRAAMVANQTMVIETLPEARSRSSTIYMGHVWGGNAIGAALATQLFAHFGWIAVCGAAFAAALLALGLATVAFRRT